MQGIPRTLVLGGEGRGGSLFWSWSWLVGAVNTGSTPRARANFAGRPRFVIRYRDFPSPPRHVDCYLYLASAPALPR